MRGAIQRQPRRNGRQAVRHHPAARHLGKRQARQEPARVCTAVIADATDVGGADERAGTEPMKRRRGNPRRRGAQEKQTLPGTLVERHDQGVRGPLLRDDRPSLFVLHGAVVVARPRDEELPRERFQRQTESEVNAGRLPAASFHEDHAGHRQALLGDFPPVFYAAAACVASKMDRAAPYAWTHLLEVVVRDVDGLERFPKELQADGPIVQENRADVGAKAKGHFRPAAIPSPATMRRFRKM